VRILLLGSSGTVGLSVEAALDRLGCVTTTQRSGPEYRGVYFDAEQLDSMEKLCEEITLRQDLVVYAAGLIGFENCENNPSRSKRINYEVPSRIGALCASEGKRFILFSTNAAAEFDGLTVSQAERAHASAERGASRLGLDRYLAENNVLAGSLSLVLRLSKVAGVQWPLIQNWITLLRTESRLRAFTDYYLSPVKVHDLSELVGRLVDVRATGLVSASAADQRSYY